MDKRCCEEGRKRRRKKVTGCHGRTPVRQARSMKRRVRLRRARIED
jgi:hypothetical protein